MNDDKLIIESEKMLWNIIISQFNWLNFLFSVFVLSFIEFGIREQTRKSNWTNEQNKWRTWRHLNLQEKEKKNETEWRSQRIRQQNNAKLEKRTKNKINK